MIGQTLSDLRLKRGLSQVELAKLVGVEERTIRRWEIGEGPIPSYRLATVTRVLRVDYNTLMKAMGEMEAVDAREVDKWEPSPPPTTETNP